MYLFFFYCRLCGVDIQSQTAYELAAKGPIRPANPKIPVIYGIKCVEFNLPDFTIGSVKIFVLFFTILALFLF